MFTFSGFTGLLRYARNDGSYTSLLTMQTRHSSLPGGVASSAIQHHLQNNLLIIQEPPLLTTPANETRLTSTISVKGIGDRPPSLMALTNAVAHASVLCPGSKDSCFEAWPGITLEFRKLSNCNTRPAARFPGVRGKPCSHWQNSGLCRSNHRQIPMQAHAIVAC